MNIKVGSALWRKVLSSYDHESGSGYSGSTKGIRSEFIRKYGDDEFFDLEYSLIQEGYLSRDAHNWIDTSTPEHKIRMTRTLTSKGRAALKTKTRSTR